MTPQLSPENSDAVPSLFSPELLARFTALRATLDPPNGPPVEPAGVGRVSIDYATGMASLFLDAVHEIAGQPDQVSAQTDLLVLALFDASERRKRQAAELTSMSSWTATTFTSGDTP